MEDEKKPNPTCTGDLERAHSPQIMHKSGMVWSGRTKRQRYTCWLCGRTTTIVAIRQP